MDAEIEAQIEAELEAEIAAELAGPSARRGGYTRRYINRDHEEDHNRLFAKYFSDSPLYTDEQFRRRFRMRKQLPLLTFGFGMHFLVLLDQTMILMFWTSHHCSLRNYKEEHLLFSLQSMGHNITWDIT